MTCYDCIHYEVCDWDKDKYDKSIITSFPDCNEKNCGLFQNKADFVEVVRCKECEHRKNGIQGYYCDLTDFLIKDDDFCSHGERRDA